MRQSRIWDAATFAELAALRGHEDGIRSTAFSPNSARIVTASRDRTARIWDPTTRTELARILFDASVTTLAIHRTAILFGDILGRIHVFDAEDYLG